MLKAIPAHLPTQPAPSAKLPSSAVNNKINLFERKSVSREATGVSSRPKTTERKPYQQ